MFPFEIWISVFSYFTNKKEILKFRLLNFDFFRLIENYCLFQLKQYEKYPFIIRDNSEKLPIEFKNVAKFCLSSPVNSLHLSNNDKLIITENSHLNLNDILQNKSNISIKKLGNPCFEHNKFVVCDKIKIQNVIFEKSVLSYHDETYFKNCAFLKKIVLLFDSIILRKCQIFNKLIICHIHSTAHCRQIISSILKNNNILNNDSYFIKGIDDFINQIEHSKIKNDIFEFQEYNKRVCDFEITFYVKVNN